MRTRVTKLLGIKHPIIQPGMALISFVPLAAAVCEAGALGILTATEQTPEELRQNIRRMRELTDKPFGVNLVPYNPGYSRLAKVVFEENVPVLSHGLGNPFRVLGIKKPKGMLFVPSVGNVRHAKRMEEEGADALIVSGWEGGGHVGYIGSMVLIPQVVESVKIPVIAAGGICDSRGLAAALALGAEGVAMGTRFALTQESPTHPAAKEYLLEARAEEATLSLRYDGLRARSVKGEKVKNYLGWWSRPWEVLTSILVMRRIYKGDLKEFIDAVRIMKRTVRVSLLQFPVGIEMSRRGVVMGDTKMGVFPAGQVVGRISELPTCQELVEKVVAEAEEIIRSMGVMLSQNNPK